MLLDGMSKCDGLHQYDIRDPGVRVSGAYYGDVLLPEMLLLAVRQVSGEFIFQQVMCPAESRVPVDINVSHGIVRRSMARSLMINLLHIYCRECTSGRTSKHFANIWSRIYGRLL